MCVETTNNVTEDIPVEGQEETIVTPPPPITGDEFHKYTKKYKEGLNEEQLEHMIMHGTTWIGGDINNNKRKCGTCHNKT